MKDLTKKINWKKVNGLVPAVIQNVSDGQVLMLGYMDKAALKKTQSTGKVWFYGRTKKRLWMKGETSGNILKLVDIAADCDSDSLLLQVVPVGKTCHLGNQTCFDGTAYDNPLMRLYGVLEQRKKDMPKNSYTASLFKKGVDKICAKIGEESGEVIKAAQKESKKRVVEESVDLLYHLFVLNVFQKISLKEIFDEIIKRS